VNNQFTLFTKDEPRIGIVIGTGPSLTPEVIEQCKQAQKQGIKLFGCNSAFLVFELDVFHACNPEYYDLYWDKLKDYPADKWTWDKDCAEKYKINYIEGIWADGLSTDPNKIHYHHGSNPQLVNIAYHYGVKKMLLVGWDMRYPGKIGNQFYTEKRHFHDENPLTIKHYPQTGSNGEFTGLIKEMETIKPKDYGIDIVNCTPNSAMTCFPMMDLADAIKTP